MADQRKLDTLLALALSGLAVTGTVALVGSGLFAIAGQFEASAVALAAAAIAFGALATVLLRQ